MKVVDIKIMKHLISKILVFTLFVIACQSKQEFSSNQPILSDIPDQEGWNSTLTSTNNGKITSKIKYVHMQQYSNKNLIKFVEGVEINFYDSEGVHTSKIYANEAKLTDSNKNLELMGNVKVLSDNGFKLDSEKLNWNDYNGKISSDKFVTIITAENDTIIGVGFESDKSLINWIIKKPSGVTQKSLNLQEMKSSPTEKTDENN